VSIHDGSLFPTSIGANPQLSIYGPTANFATKLAERLKPSDGAWLIRSAPVNILFSRSRLGHDESSLRYHPTPQRIRQDVTMNRGYTQAP
jgi:hypothetical protein